MKILGIESSCDETAAAVVLDGHKILSSKVASQIEIHHPYGGVVPELASRQHIENILPVVEDAMDQADLKLSELDAIAVTQGPGLIGSLLVGFSFAKALAYGLKIPWIGINHLQGHLYSVFLDHSQDGPGFPFVALLVSGGHTGIYLVKNFTETELLGQTRDDAAGEAFDKVSKLLGLGYPGGGVIAKLACQGDSRKIIFPRTYLDKTGFDFSFSGVKTAVLRYTQKNKDYLKEKADIAAGFQEAVVDVLTYKILHAVQKTGCWHLAIVGGVAANQHLRQTIQKQASPNLGVHIPSIDLCGDNAAMIAGLAYHYLLKDQSSPWDADVYARTLLKKST